MKVEGKGGRIADASLPGAIFWHLPPGAATSNLKRLSISHVVTRSRPYLARALALALAAGLSFLNITRLESDLGAVDFAIDLVVAVDEADILGLGATFERTSTAA